MDPEHLLQSLEGCVSLEALTLVNVHWKGKFERKVHLPSLRSFFLSRANFNIGATSAQELMDSIFFYSSAAALKTWNQSFLYTSKATLRLEEAGGWVSKYQFKLSFDQTSLLVHSFLEDLTKYFSFTEFHLLGVFDVDLALLPAVTLKKLHLEHVNLISTSAQPTKFEALQELTLYSVSLCSLLNNSTQAIFPSSNLKNIDLFDLTCDGMYVDVSSFLRNRRGLASLALDLDFGSLDLSDLEASRKTLRYLSLTLEGFGDIIVYQSVAFQFTNLKRLLLYGKFTFESPKLFSETFQNTEEMEFVGFPFKPGFLKEVLKTRVRFIEFRLYAAKVDWGAEVESFFAQAGVLKHLDLEEYQFRRTNGTWTCDYDEKITSISDLEMARERDVVMCAYALSLIGICSLGILGNVLSGGVLSRKRMRSSTSFILLGLTLSDLTLLLTSLFSVVFYGIKLILVFLNYPIKKFSYAFLWMDISFWDAEDLEHRQSQILYPLSKTGISKNYTKLQT